MAHVLQTIISMIAQEGKEANSYLTWLEETFTVYNFEQKYVHHTI